MIATRFATKAMTVLFMVPLLGQFGLYANVKPVRQFLVTKAAEASNPTGIDAKQLELATQSLAMTAKMDAGGQADPKLEQMLNSLSDLSQTKTAP